MPEFVESLPPAQGGRPSAAKESEYDSFAAALKAKPMNWAKWPKEFETYSAANACVNNIKRGNYVSFRPEEEWQAAQRGETVYIRFVGDHRDHI